MNKFWQVRAVTAPQQKYELDYMEISVWYPYMIDLRYYIVHELKTIRRNIVSIIDFRR